MLGFHMYRTIPSAGLILIIILISLSDLNASAQERRLIREQVNHQPLSIVSGKAVVVKTGTPIKRVSVGNPDVADFILLSPYELYIAGKAAGTTNMIVWKNNDISDIYDIEVSYDLNRLKQQLHQLLPEETDIQVMETSESFTLFGKVSSTANLSQALAIAKAYAPEEKINNLLQVGGIHQVMLEVRLAEMSRTIGKNLGINLSYTRGDEFGLTTLDGLSQIVSPNDANYYTHSNFGTVLSSAVNGFFRWSSGHTTWTNIIDALKEDGLAKILAEPTLIALSGEKAGFLAGGEFPIPVPEDGGIGIEYKEFGVGLSFTPTVLSRDKINIRVDSEVSELDFSTAVKFGGYVVPGVSTRNAQTTIELADGQSFAIAGLLQETIREESSRYPFLGEIPILGALFKSSSYQKSETELVILVTARLVTPMDMEGYSLPTDHYQEPTDFELFFNTGHRYLSETSRQMPAGKLDGDFGHAMESTE